MKACTVLALGLLGCGWMHAQSQQERQSFGVHVTYAADSSHILIGSAEKRRIWTAGMEYSHVLTRGREWGLHYQGTFSPFFQEQDPRLVGVSGVPNGCSVNLGIVPQRVTTVSYQPIGILLHCPGSPIPIYAVYRHETTYGVTATPLGVRVNLLTRHRYQPTFSAEMGFAWSTRDIPIERSAKFNYVFDFGPGMDLYSSPRYSTRVEYVFHHISNAGDGDFNPGIDSGTFRVTVSWHR